MENLTQLIDDLLENPTEENKNELLETITQQEVLLLQEAEAHEFKSREYFCKRTLAFKVRPTSAMTLVPKWISKFGSSEGCPLQFSDTLNIPFRQVKC